MNTNPWNTGSDVQKQWMAKWRREQEICQECEDTRERKCNVLDRMDKNICQLLRERTA